MTVGVKYAPSESAPSGGLKVNDFIFLPNAPGPTDTTGYWAAYDSSDDYVIYFNKASQGPSIYAAANNQQLISLYSTFTGFVAAKPVISFDTTAKNLQGTFVVNGLTNLTIQMTASGLQSGVEDADKGIIHWLETGSWGSVRFLTNRDYVLARFGTGEEGNNIGGSIPLGSSLRTSSAIKEGANERLIVDNVTYVNTSGKLTTIANTGNVYTLNKLTTSDLREIIVTKSGATLGLSLTKINPSYTGNCIRIRKQSDNTETNIGFVDGELDESSINTFCSGTNCFVTTWYDQFENSGGNATQASSSLQPKIYDSSTGITRDGTELSPYTAYLYFSSLPECAIIFSEEYQAILYYASSQGWQLPTARQQFLQNDLLTSLVNEGIFSQLDTLYVMANNGSQEFSTINWINPGTNNLIAAGATPPTYSPGNGWTSTGAGWMNTQFVFSGSSKLQQTSATAFAFVQSAILSAHILGHIGTAGVDELTLRFFNSSTTNNRIMTNANATASIDFSGTGLKQAYSTGANAQSYYEDGVLLRTQNRTSQGPDILNPVGIFRSADSIAAAGMVVSVLGFGANTVSQEQSLSDAINTYMTNRNT